MWAVVPTDKNHPVAQIGQSLIIMPRTGGGGNAGVGEGCRVGCAGEKSNRRPAHDGEDLERIGRQVFDFLAV